MTDQPITTGHLSLDDFRSAFLVNWDEVFTSVTGIFLDKGDSMFETLTTISAEEASRPIGGGCASIAAQVNHIWFYLDLINRRGRGEDVGRPDWEGSWQVGEVDEAAWRTMIDELRGAKDEVIAFVTTFEDWDERMIGGAFGVLAHCAYHLGEIRTGLCTTKGNRDKNG
jgi:hypothetical protein